MLLRFILAKLLLLLVFCTKAQFDHYNFSRLDIESGLSNNEVKSVFRDSNGFVWLGTTEGLNRFDGFTCKVFVNIPYDTNSLKDNDITELFDLPDHKLWVGSKNSVDIYDPVTEKFSRNYVKYLNQLSLPPSRASSILKDRNGNYWFLFEKEGLYKFSPQLGKTVHFTEAHNPSSTIIHIQEDSAGNIWVINTRGLLRQIESSTLTVCKQISLLSDNCKSKITDYRFIIDRQNKFWVWSKAEPVGVFKLDPIKDKIILFHTGNPSFRLNNNLVRGIVQDLKGAIWIGTDHGGVNVVEEQDNRKIIYLENRENDKGSLSYNSVESIYQDGRGIIWVGTGKKGVSYVNENIPRFELFQHEPDNKSSLPYNDVIYFVADKKDNLWIGTDGGGLLYFDRKKNKFTQYLNNPSKANSLCNNVVVSLCLDHNNKLWIGTFLGGMDCFDGRNFIHYRHDPADSNSIADNGIWHILEDSAHVLWIGTLRGGLDRFDRATQKFTHYYIQDNIPHPIHSNYISVIREGRQHNLWMGTSEGMEELNPERNQFTYYTQTDKINSLSNPLVMDICEDKRGWIWIATKKGLNVLNRKTRTFKQFYINDGLPDNTVTNIAEDKNGNLWITTPKGLCQLIINPKGDTPTFTVRNFNEVNNLQGKIFNESACMVTAAGEIVVGGSTGFNIIDPGKIAVYQTNPNLEFTSIAIFNNEVSAGQVMNQNVVLKKALPFADQIKLKHNDNIFSIEFAALDFSHNNQYAYQLEGFNTNWMHTDNNNRKVTYTNLDPGTYYFKLKATNSEGKWGAEKRLKIVILPPFWKTPLALLLYVLFIVGILFIARRYILEKARMRFEMEQQKKEAERIKALDAVKTKFFTNVSHEFRTPLSLIISPLDRLLKKSTDPEQKKQVQLVQRNAKRLLSLINQLLDFRKMEVQEFKLQRTKGDMTKFLRELTCSFSDMAEIKNITLSFTSNTESFPTYFDKDKVEKIMFNLLSNAFKYTPNKGRVEVAFYYQDGHASGRDKIQISVRDTGIGIPKDKQEQIFERFFQNEVPANITHPGTGIGLAITKEFVKLQNGSITLKSEPDHGSIFTIVLPVQKPTDTLVQTEEVNELIRVSTDVEERAVDRGHNKIMPIILLVEDDDDFRFYLKDNFKPTYQVIETQNGQEAWELLQEIQPDLIVSDVMMPYMDGIELTKRVKKNSALLGIPIILLTAVGDEELQLESYRLGVSDYIQKPFTFEILASRIKNVLAQKKLPHPPSFVNMHPAEPDIVPADELFIKQVLAIVEKNINNPEFTVEELSKELFMHRAGVYRKLLSMTGKTPIEFIRQIRLKRSAQLLVKSGMNIAEVAYEVGFNNPKKFSQYFKEEFGTTPSEYQKKKKKKTFFS